MIIKLRKGQKYTSILKTIENVNKILPNRQQETIEYQYLKP